jgi:hypothetical protein
MVQIYQPSSSSYGDGWLLGNGDYDVAAASPRPGGRGMLIALASVKLGGALGGNHGPGELLHGKLQFAPLFAGGYVQNGTFRGVHLT